MKTELKYTAFFYEENGEVCRKYLNIKLESCTKTYPDLILICLNPGSCKYDESKLGIETTVDPDPTINQISKLIEGDENTHFIRLLNLSNYRDSNSEDVKSNIKEHEKYSIFNSQNNEDLNYLIPNGSKIILAWGTDDRTKTLSKMAIERLEGMNVTILNKIESKYYHPLVRGKKRTEWIDEKSALIKKHFSVQPQ